VGQAGQVGGLGRQADADEADTAIAQPTRAATVIISFVL